MEVSLSAMPLGITGHITRCLSPSKNDVYRLLELGLYKGASFKVLRSDFALGVMEIALNSSRICIGKDLANEFLAIIKS